jgi:hypothetical protein
MYWAAAITHGPSEVKAHDMAHAARIDLRHTWSVHATLSGGSRVATQQIVLRTWCVRQSRCRDARSRRLSLGLKKTVRAIAEFCMRVYSAAQL